MDSKNCWANGDFIRVFLLYIYGACFYQMRFVYTYYIDLFVFNHGDVYINILSDLHPYVATHFFHHAEINRRLVQLNVSESLGFNVALNNFAFIWQQRTPQSACTYIVCLLVSGRVFTALLSRAASLERQRRQLSCFSWAVILVRVNQSLNV